jgi:hypothetical protein
MATAYRLAIRRLFRASSRINSAAGADPRFDRREGNAPRTFPWQATRLASPEFLAAVEYGELSFGT